MKRATLLFTGAAAEFAVLQPQKFQPLMARLPTVNGWSGERAFAWAVREAPFVEVADADVEAAYYFRLKVMREHTIETGFDAAPFAFSECRYPTTEADPAKPRNPSNGTVGCLWGDAQGVINAASGHHLAEARWLRNATYHDSYLRYFFARPMRYANGTEATTTPPRVYTSWQTMALRRSLGVGGDLTLARALLPSLVANVEGWVREHRFDRCPTGACDCEAADEDPFATCNPGAPRCFHIEDGWDAMENSVSGGGCRPTISGAVYAEAAAVSDIAAAVGETDVSETMARVAADIRDMYLATFWNDKGYFAVLKLNKTQYARDGHSFDGTRDSTDWYDYDCGTLGPDAQHKNCSSDLWPCDALADAEELLGLGSPWFFGVVPYDETAKYEAAWKSLSDGFAGPHGLRTAALDVQGLCPLEASNYSAMVSCGCYNYSHSECAWNAPSWPYETSRVLTAMSDVLHGARDGRYSAAQAAAVGRTDFEDLLAQYARQHTKGAAPNASSELPYLGENIHADDGYWIARSMMYGAVPGAQGTPPTPDRNRNVDYFHSTFVDLVLGGLLGIRGALEDRLVIAPLTQSRFAVDNLKYHGRDVAITFDPDGGTVYGCPGLCAYVDGTLVASNASAPLNLTLV